MGQFVTTEVISSQIDDVTVESTQTESACTQPERLIRPRVGCRPIGSEHGE